jgi:gamma-butyrobetaine dioxygenase
VSGGEGRGGVTERWSFDDHAGPPRFHQALAERGYALCRAPGLAEAAERDPWAVARRLHGGDVDLVEAHPIHPVPHGRSFAATSGFTPLHTDSQSRRGVPPRWQVMLCVRPASEGGQTLLLDTWPLLAHIETAEPPLFQALLTRTRRMPFVFGDIVGPTVSLRGGGLVFTHSPVPVGDDVERALAPWLHRAPLIELGVDADEVLVVDNHRMLHGRRAFEDARRRFLRLLVWTGIPAAAPPRLHEAAAAVHAALARTMVDQPPVVREARLGASPSPDPEGARRLRIVLEMLRGTSPGVLSRRHGVPEPELYRWRDAVLRASEAALGGTSR